ncbi:MAG: hypothetical protein KGL43_06945 [Burkholderiales bacterium]|nr:hypothetical protein [Burkholderiales bacterium]MDE2394757.1 hypothetical protein [Burkholderiales bacterium]MDE2453314.1 hypothetical protein [Burkholderiales bacterium]
MKRVQAPARGLVLLSRGHSGNAIRFLCPPTIPEAVFEAARQILEAALLAP